MRIAIGTDIRRPLYDEIINYLFHNKYEFVEFTSETSNWAEVGIQVAEAVSSQHCNQGILVCETGTGVTIAANKVRGVRAALCNNAETVVKAKLWNLTNVLCIASYAKTEDLKEILNKWFSTAYGNKDVGYAVDYIHDYENRIR